MSYLPPHRWWMRPLRVFARCQRLTIDEQIASGARVFDMRVFWDGQGWRFAHGMVSFRCGEDLYSILMRLPEESAVRLILERDGERNRFRDLCRRLEGWPGLTVFGGYLKPGWIPLYDFAANNRLEPRLRQWVGSMARDARWYERLIPVLYARRIRTTLPFEDHALNIYDFYDNNHKTNT